MKANWPLTWPDQNPMLGVHEALRWISPVFLMGMSSYGGSASVNYGTNGKHSANSAHGRGKAIDIHHKDVRFSWVNGALTKDWYFALVQLAGSLVKVANEMSRLTNSETEYFLVVEPGHFHLEITLHGEAPNIKGWQKDLKKYLYVHADVRKILEATDPSATTQPKKEGDTP